MFRDNPAVSTRGRYFFAPQGAPHYPGFHNLTSSVWYDRNWIDTPPLGERPDARHVWQQGNAPELQPAALRIGSPDCIKEGAIISAGIDAGELVDGFPAGCFPGEELSRRLWQLVSSYATCTTQKFYCAVLNWLQAGEFDRIQAAFAEFIPVGVTVRCRPEERLFPAVVTVRGPGFAIAVQNGTRTPEQFSLQAFTSLRAPTDYGSFSTLPLWMQAAHRLHDFLRADGVTESDRMFFAGHSYGAAANAVLSGIYRHATPDRTIAYFSIGCPKIGDDRLAQLVRQTAGIALCNADDPVTALPPDESSWFPLTIPFPLLEMVVWNSWRRPLSQVFQDAAGNLDPSQFPILDYSALFEWITTFLANDAISIGEPHYIQEYLRRVSLRCPGVGWTVDAELLALIESETNKRDESTAATLLAGKAGVNVYPPAVADRITLESGSFMLTEPGDKILLE